MEVFFFQLMGGLTKAMFLFLIAAGLSLIWGVSRVLNLSHACLFMVGAYLAYSLFRGMLQGSEQYFVALAIGPVLVGLIGVFLEVVLIRPLYKAERAGELIIFLTVGLIFVFGDSVRMIWGPELTNMARPEILVGSFNFFGYTFPRHYVPIMVLTPSITLVLWGLINYTRFGLLVRAATMDREMLAALGINVNRLFTIIFFMGCYLAGLAGVLAAPVVALHPAMDGEVILEAIAVVVVGGLGSLPGSLVAALLIGELEAFGILIFPAMSLLLIFAVMVLVIMFRPQGILGKPEFKD